MDYLSVAQARDLPGLRLALTAGVPGPWSESAKAIFAFKGLPYVPVAQYGGQENAELVAWTGSRNAPVAVFGNEAPRTGWYDILMLAERLAPACPLLPAASEDRALVVGLSMELCGEWGFGWARRTMILSGTPEAKPAPMPAPSSPSPFTREDSARMARAYSDSIGNSDAALGRCTDILRALAGRLNRQRTQGSSYLVGNAVTACDIYWAVFSSMLEPLPHAVNPMPDWMRHVYASSGATLRAASDPILFAHRDLIYERHLTLPMDF